MSSSSSSGGGSASYCDCSSTTWHVEQAREPSHAPSSSMSFSCAISRIVLPTSASIWTCSPSCMNTMGTRSVTAVHNGLRAVASRRSGAAA
eukprot:CAMPEP_0174727148 /NCGR_PEP_ID=MMETSP1094-20130205/49201_1 /TAXON_ID=156173 /ORGANISM="Chrysochromulina brevifilum, Strain UTEX LB 985" /LENGTH=90 /DNA_ID=CAMNT_0015928833 /DNA_START=263 /DNA_END=535 /DNA_ORIENTATION=-